MDKTAVVEGRVDHRVVAGIVLGLDTLGTCPRTKGEIVRQACEIAYELMISKGIIKPVGTLQYAMEILQVYGFGSGLAALNRSGRGKQVLRKALDLETKELEACSGDVIDLRVKVRQAEQLLAANTRMGKFSGDSREEAACFREKEIAEPLNLPKMSELMEQYKSKEEFKAIETPEVQLDISEEDEVVGVESLQDKAKRFEQEQAAEKNAMGDFLAGFVRKEE